MSSDELDDFLEAARLRQIKKRFDVLDNLPFSNINDRKILNLYNKELKKMSLEINVGLGLENVGIEQAKQDFKDVKKEISTGLRKGKLE